MQQARLAEFPFDLKRPLGRGAYGSVHEAVDRRNGQRVALKELTRLGPRSLWRFKQEFRRIADVHHPNLVRLFELFEHAGHWYIAMEVVEGQDLLSFVRQATMARAAGAGMPERRFDEGRLRQAFGGVAQGLRALHAHGILHRDLKPSNVMITPEGRAVLLDFGLSSEIRPSGAPNLEIGVGTARYMAPEQAEGAHLEQSADWYAFGVCLYEALTGRAPFEATSGYKVLLDKLREEPPALESLVSGLPPDLSALCSNLLAREPDQRPRGRGVLHVLGDSEQLSENSEEALPSTPPMRSFAGRAAELEQLERALSQVQTGAMRVVLVEGESGVGKSELLQEFAARVLAANRDALVLRGRCYENERVSYKAFDGCVDDLAQTLTALGNEASELAPEGAPLLAQVFPVLSGVAGFDTRGAQPYGGDPAARRLEAFSVLSRLFRGLAQRGPLILLIDDLQWSDVESFRLLKALREGHEEPPVLVLASVRPRDEIEPELGASIDAVRAWSCTEQLSLGGLPEEDASALLEGLLGPAFEADQLRSLARESRGNPLFLLELIHFTQGRELAAGRETLTLDAALQARIDGLPEAARALLNLVALSARPHAAQMFFHAHGASVEREVTMLLGAKLLRARQGHELECYHDRIRKTVLSGIREDRRVTLHRRLAEALSSTSHADAAELAVHWEAAGEPAHAVEAYQTAAETAFRALAFRQSEQLYERAIALRGEAHDERQTAMVTARARALACAGHSAEAAELYRQAAEWAQGEQRLVLRSRVAEHLMQSVHVGPGLDEARQLLAKIGLPLPRTPLGILARAVWNRLRTRFVRWLPSWLRPAATMSPTRLDVTQDLLRQFGIVHNGLSLALTTEYVRIAGRSSDEKHRLRAQAYEGWWQTVSGSLARGLPHFDATREAVAALGDPSLIAQHMTLEGSARMAGWQWQSSVDILERAEVLLRERCPNDPWALTVARYHLGAGWYHTGLTARLAHHSERWLREARERQDWFAVAMLAGMGAGSMRHVMRGDPQSAIAEIDQALAPIPEEPFSFPHFGHLMISQSARHLIGGRAALDYLESRSDRLDRAFLLRTRMGRETMRYYRCAAVLAAAGTMGSDERSRMLLRVRGFVRAWLHNEAPFRRGIGHASMAQLDALAGEMRSAITHAREAVRYFESVGFAAPCPARYLLGILEGGASGRAQCEAVLKGRAEQGWKTPRDALVVSMPAIAWLEG